MVLGMGMMVCPIASAYEPLVEIGVGIGAYEENLSNDAVWTLRAGVKESPIYFVGTYEDRRETSVLGQEVARSDLGSWGLGATYQVTDDINVYTEVAYVDFDNEYFDPAVHEVSYTYLVGRHGAGDRNVPTPCAYGDCYKSTYDMEDNSVSISIGAGWQIHDHVKVTASYRFLGADTTIRITDQTGEGFGSGVWEEHDRVDFGMASVSILYTY